ncbi:hypothetical protein JCM10207_004493 [Rhodosporidiobolus poonsookiae]
MGEELKHLQEGNGFSSARLGVLLYVACYRYNHRAAAVYSSNPHDIGALPFRPLVEYLLSLPVCELVDRLPFPPGVESTFLPTMVSWVGGITGSCRAFHIFVPDYNASRATPAKAATTGTARSPSAKKPASSTRGKGKVKLLPTSHAPPPKTSHAIKTLQELNEVRAALRGKEEEVERQGLQLAGIKARLMELEEDVRRAKKEAEKHVCEAQRALEEEESALPTQTTKEDGDSHALSAITPATSEPTQPSSVVLRPSPPPTPESSSRPLPAEAPPAGDPSSPVIVGKSEPAGEMDEAAKTEGSAAGGAENLEATLLALKQENTRLRTTLALTSSALASATSLAARPASSSTSSCSALSAGLNPTTSLSGASTPLAAPARRASTSASTSVSTKQELELRRPPADGAVNLNVGISRLSGVGGGVGGGKGGKRRKGK